MLIAVLLDRVTPEPGYGSRLATVNAFAQHLGIPDPTVSPFWSGRYVCATYLPGTPAQFKELRQYLDETRAVYMMVRPDGTPLTSDWEALDDAEEEIRGYERRESEAPCTCEACGG